MNQTWSTDGAGNRWDGYARTLRVSDPDVPGSTGPPVHVMTRQSVTLNGTPIVTRSITVDASFQEGTVVTMQVRAEDVVDGDGDPYAYRIGGHRVCTPVGDGWRWETDATDDEWVACSLYLAEVIFGGSADT